MMKNSPDFDLTELKSIPESLDLLEKNFKIGLILINDLRLSYEEKQDEISSLKIQNEELGSLANPYSPDGEAICNSDSH